MTGDSAARRRRLLAASEAEAFALDAVWRAEVEGLIGRMREKAAGLPRVVAERPPVIARLPRWVPVVYWSVAASLALAFVVALPPRRPASRRNGGCGTWDEGCW